jgi:hypothetical protein
MQMIETRGWRTFEGLTHAGAFRTSFSRPASFANEIE